MSEKKIGREATASFSRADYIPAEEAKFSEFLDPKRAIKGFENLVKAVAERLPI